jgi:hypothetical protein
VNPKFSSQSIDGTCLVFQQPSPFNAESSHVWVLDIDQYLICTLAHTWHSLNQGILVKTPRSSIFKTLVFAAITSAMGWISVGVHAQDQPQTQKQVYGYQLMSDAERAAYQTKMRTLKTTAERDAFRTDHHDQMKARAAEKGLTLPDAPMMNKTGKAQASPGTGQGSAGSSGAGAGGGPGGGKGGR